MGRKVAWIVLAGQLACGDDDGPIECARPEVYCECVPGGCPVGYVCREADNRCVFAGLPDGGVPDASPLRSQGR